MRPGTAPCNITFEGTTEKGKSLNSPCHFCWVKPPAIESMRREGWPKLVCSPGPSLQSHARPRLVTRIDVEGIQPWRCRILELYVSEQTLQPIKVWIPSGGHILDWLPHGRQSSFCSQWDHGKGDAEFLMWPTNFQLIPINFSLDLSETELC